MLVEVRNLSGVQKNAHHVVNFSLDSNIFCSAPNQFSDSFFKLLYEAKAYQI